MPAAVAALVAATISVAPCPGVAEPTPCAVLEPSPSTPIIYLNGRRAGTLTVLMHERGHVFSDRALDDVERSALAAHRGWPTWREEAFADAFASCWIGQRQRKVARISGVAVGKRDPKFCSMVVRMAS